MIDPSDHPDDDPADVFPNAEDAEDPADMSHMWSTEARAGIAIEEEPPEIGDDPDLLLAHLVATSDEALRLEAIVCEELGWDITRLEAALTGLPGLVDRWPLADAGPSLILSEYTARAQGWRLSAEEGGKNPWRWVALGVDDPAFSSSRSTRIVLETDLTRHMYGDPKDLLDHFEDVGAERPEIAARRAEMQVAEAKVFRKILGGDSEYLPRPSVFLGLALPFPYPSTPDGRCAGCARWRELAVAGNWRRHVVAYCLACEWYSMGYLLPRKIVLPIGAKDDAVQRRRACVKDKLGYTAA